MTEAADALSTRRTTLRWIAQSALVPPLLSALSLTARAQGLPATPACGAHAEPTRKQTEGPFFTRNSPQRQSLLEPGLQGERLILVGQVLDLDCKPVAGALLDFWQADASGQYDNAGFRLRGHQFADAQGRYRLETLVPANYPGRTRHIHVKAQAPGGRVLTTQLYFPDDPANRRDRLYKPELLMTLARSGGAAQGAFDFVLADKAHPTG